MIEHYTVNITEINTGIQTQLISSVPQVNVTSLHPFYNYDCAVSAFTVKAGPYTEFITAVTLEAKPASGPRNLEVFPLSSTSILIQWDSLLPEDENGIIVSCSVTVKQTDDNDKVLYRFSNSTEVILDGLLPFTDYTCNIAAQNNAGLGPATANIHIRTLEAGRTLTD